MEEVFLPKVSVNDYSSMSLVIFDSSFPRNQFSACHPLNNGPGTRKIFLDIAKRFLFLNNFGCSFMFEKLLRRYFELKLSR